MAADLQAFLQRLDAVLLAGQGGADVAVLHGEEEDLGVALVPHLAEGVQGQLAVTHALLHHLHLLLQQLFGLHTHTTTQQCTCLVPHTSTLSSLIGKGVRELLFF